MSKSVLIVDDDVDILRAIGRFLTGRGFRVEICREYERACEKLLDQHFDLALLDLKIQGHSGMELVHFMRSHDLKSQIIIMTGHSSIDSAVQAIKEGAYYYISKPFELDELLDRINMALEVQTNNEMQERAHQTLAKTQVQSQVIVGISTHMRRLMRVVGKVAPTDSTVLILGESGTGKEVLARALHTQSLRARAPFIAVNCAAIPNELLESELFGFMKGAFTGAQSNRKGRFEMASGGTIFLDEIGDMPLHLQVKLLRVIQEKRVEPLGASYGVDVDVRIIAATNKKLEEEVAKGSFREDLYYRLNVIPLRVPNLTERKQDIPLFVDYFLKKYAQAYNSVPPHFDKNIIASFQEHQWPGNVRELENLIERLVILYAGKKIPLDALPFSQNKKQEGLPVKIPEDGIALKDLLYRFENEIILKVLERTSWNKNKAASLLHLNRTTLVEKIKKRGLEDSSKAQDS